jgi:hypothetical protein
VVTAPASLPSERGPWFIAAYEGACDSCGEDIIPDDEIRADGHGGWEGRCCEPADPSLSAIDACQQASNEIHYLTERPGALGEFFSQGQQRR